MGKKMDQKLAAGKQSYEIAYISKKFKVPAKVVRDLIKELGNSRRKIYAALRDLGYDN